MQRRQRMRIWQLFRELWKSTGLWKIRVLLRGATEL
jgi:hypothetical protein